MFPYSFPPVILSVAHRVRRRRVSRLAPGAALVAVAVPQPILGYCYRAGRLTVYVPGPMPLALRTAQEEGYTQDEVWLVPAPPAGLAEIDLTDSKHAFRLLLPQEAAA